MSTSVLSLNETSSIQSNAHSTRSYELKSPLKTKKGLSYVIGDTNNKDNHILPINTIQYSQTQQSLFTGGRDGAVKVWQDPTSHNDQDQNQDQYQPESQSNFTDSTSLDYNDIDERLLRLETAISSNPLPYNTSAYDPKGFKIVGNHNLHFDWVNDLQLINHERQLASCSSDLSIKITDLTTLVDSTSPPPPIQLPNIHTDYIKKLSYSSQCPSQLVSAGLDGNIINWDLNILRPLQIIENHTLTNVPSSIYSLASNDHNIICTGGPSKTINLYDTRASTQFIRQLIGHQDNIRCLLMNDNFILSGSSDTTIKLWDLRTFKVYKNFDIHDYPVWSLSSTDTNSLNFFYSGDDHGNIVKTDLSNLFMNNNNKNSVNNTKSSVNNTDAETYYSKTFTTSETAALDEKLGISTVVSSNNSPILSICLESHNQTIFASDYKSLNRYVAPNTQLLSKYQFLKNCEEYIASKDVHFGPDDTVLNELHSPTSPPDDINSHFCDLVSQLSFDNNTVHDIQSTFSQNANNKYTGTPPTFDDHNDELDDLNDSDTEEFSSMFLNIGGGPSTEFINCYKQDHEFENPLNLNNTESKTTFNETNDTNKSQTQTQTQSQNQSQSQTQSQNQNQRTNGNYSLKQTQFLDLIPVEILLNPLPADQIIIIPFNSRATAEYEIVPRSVVSKRLFDNKRQIMVLYLNGDIKVWDILICRELKHLPSRQGKLLNGKELEIRTKEMETLFQSMQKSDTLNNWCEVEIKAGKLMVTIRETSAMNVEIYYDDLIKDYPFLAVDSPSQRERLGKHNQIKVTNDDRFHLGLILLNSIFQGYTLYEWVFDGLVRDEIRNNTHSKVSGGAHKTATPKLEDLDENGNMSNIANLGNSGTGAGSGSGSGTGAGAASGASSGSVGSGIRRLTNWGKKSSSKRNLPTMSGISNQHSPATSTNTSVIDVPISESSPLAEFMNFSEKTLSRQIADYNDSIMNLLQTNKKIYQDRSSGIHSSNNNNNNNKLVDSVLRIDHVNPRLNDNLDDDELKYYPVIPTAELPQDMNIIVFEHSPELGNYRDLFCFNVGEVSKLATSKVPNLQLINDLRSIVPRWVGQPILYSRYNIKEPPKITFQLIETDYLHLPPHVRIGGRSQRKVKSLPALESSIKLTSHSMLRVSKILHFLTDKFESSTKEMRDKKLKPTDWLVLECRGQELSNSMTLQTIKTKIWKSSTDIELRYRRKFDQ
ncbi:hypothetical protein PVL30_003063 [Lodderomyces elongisporus]|uniref:uncharacterized protein n=1 Tax=Lodderomyces elongisporus TaxID=36914 RepID=UPI0029227C11|nr:uncharacterized protein PVL30_003063 [Lodderomyces elongisporus]WLF79311.1 hypothetical protein PVL30_003063 [Lodderomyces elongisporus]